MTSVSGTEGYAAEADNLFRRYENISFAEVHRSVLHLIPTAPCLVLDIGSGTGRDAAALAAGGHRVVAVEPTAEMRMRNAALHPSRQIEWLDDSLPDLTHALGLGKQFDVVMMTTAWMHLDQQQRRRAMPGVASLVRAGGGDDDVLAAWASSAGKTHVCRLCRGDDRAGKGSGIATANEPVGPVRARC